MLRQPVRGYSLPLVILLMAVLAAAGTAAVVGLTATAETTAAMINRRQAFYACDGVGRAAMVKSREYMKTDATPTTNELMTSVCGAVASCPNKASYAPDGFAVDTLDLSTSGGAAIAPLPNGPFRGMNARQTDVRVLVEATKLATTARCRIDENISLGEIGLFQFFVFSDGYMDLFNGPAMDIDGRVHVNGNFCAHPSNGSSGNLSIRQVTASGRVKVSCAGFGKTNRGDGGREFFFVPTVAANLPLRASNESGCTSCAPTPPSATSWRTYASTRWSDAVQDVDHNVPNLRLPFVGRAAVQDGRDQSGGGVDNSNTMRAIVDPVQPADSAEVKQQKLAFKSDLRIINGVWYKRDPASPDDWPGIAIWSDHPGNFTTTGEENMEPFGRQVGQAQLAVQHGWPSVPRRYSMYEANGRVLTNATATPSVVSYGALMRTAAGTWEPGFYKGNGANQYCTGVGGAGDGVLFASSAACPQAPAQAHVLMAARTGFQDVRVRNGVAGTPSDAEKWRIVPVNFDVAAFAAALADNTPGELGSHFPNGFNGIVWIGNTWRGEMANASTSTSLSGDAALWPNVHGGAAPASAGAQSSHSAGASLQTNRLPFALCSEGPSVAGAFGDGAYFADGNPFVIPSCGGGADGIRGTDDDPTTRMNAVRVWNAATLDVARFPRGLSIATNGPIYVLGDTNTSSNAAPRTPPSTSLAGNWKPMMIAGDAVTLHSNNWSDAAASWNLPATGFAGGTGNRASPTATTWLIAVIGGNVETSATAWGGGINNFPRFSERWNSTTTNITGSLVIAFRSVFQRQPWVQHTGAGDSVDNYSPPTRTWVYDANLALPSDQPPGTPSFFVQAVQHWRRE